MLVKKYIARYPIKTDKKTYQVGETVPADELIGSGVTYLKMLHRIEEIHYVEPDPVIEEEKKVIEAEAELYEEPVLDDSDEESDKFKKKGKKAKR